VIANTLLNGKQLWQSWARMEELQGNTAAAVSVYAESTLHFESNVQLWVRWAKLEADSGNDLKVHVTMLHYVFIQC
jgi:hypothetical protein